MSPSTSRYAATTSGLEDLWLDTWNHSWEMEARTCCCKHQGVTVSVPVKWWLPQLLAPHALAPPSQHSACGFVIAATT